MRVVVGLDGSEYADAATRLACCLAKPVNGLVIGVAVVDKPGIEASSRGAGIGAYAYAKMIREERLADASAHAVQFLSEFESRCAELGASSELASRAGVPFQCIVDEGRYADLIVVGSRTFFHYETSDDDGDTLKRLMEISVCPVLAAPAGATDCPKHAIIASDGSIQSARAMRSFVYLMAGRDNPPAITVLNVGEGGDEDNHVQLESAQRYVESHGLAANVETRQGRASEQIEAAALERGDSLIVMGAHGRRGVISNIFFGSTAANIIHNQRVPLFVYH